MYKRQDLNPRQAAEKLMHDFAFAKQCSPQWGLQVTERSCVSKMEGPRPDKLWLDPDKPPANACLLYTSFTNLAFDGFFTLVIR